MYTFYLISIILLSIWALVKKYRIWGGLPCNFTSFFRFWFICIIVSQFLYILSGIGFSIVKLVSPMGGIFLAYVAFSILVNKADYGKFVKTYKTLAFFLIIIFFIQEALYFYNGYRIPGVLFMLPISYDFEDLDAYAKFLSLSTRSSSLFSEPAHFAQFLCPLLAIELLNSKSRLYDYVFPAIVIVVLIRLNSGNAYLGLLVILLFWVFKALRGKVFEKYLVYLLLFSILISIPMIMGTESIETIENRSGELSNKNTERTSGFERIYRGYYFITEMIPYEFVTGINNKELLSYRIQNSNAKKYFEKNDDYFNGLQNLFIKTGFCGFFLFFYSLYLIYRKGNMCSRCLIIMTCLYMAIASIFFTYSLVMYLFVAINNRKKNDLFYKKINN